MKVVILAGGLGWRLSDDNELRPKPMTEIGNQPVIYHTLRYFSHYGFDDFVVALGQRGEYLKKYIVDFFTIGGNVVLDGSLGKVSQTAHEAPAWRIEMVDTGVKTQTGGRVKRLRQVLGDAPFIVTSGDILHNIDLAALVAQHRRRGRLATVAAVRPPTRFQRLEIDDDLVVDFGAEDSDDRPMFGSIGVHSDFGTRRARDWIGSGLFVMEPAVLDYIDGDRTHLDREPLVGLSRAYQLGAYRHSGFWYCVDTMRDKRRLDEMWEEGRAPWKVWPDAATKPSG